MKYIFITKNKIYLLQSSCTLAVFMDNDFLIIDFAARNCINHIFASVTKIRK